MAWSASAIFQQAMFNPIAHGTLVPGSGFPTTYGGVTADTVNCALYGTTPTPNKADTAANCAWNAGQWVTANESSGAGYTLGGQALASKTFTIDTGSSSICFTAANVSWTSATLAAVYGDLVYDHTTTVVANQGFCYNYFGGTQSVTAGTFTIQWATPVSAAITAVFNISV